MPFRPLPVLKLLGSIGVATMIAACGAAPRESRPTFALIPMGTTDEYWKAVHAGAVRAGKQYGVNIIWQGPMKRDDRIAQIDVVENMIVRGVDGIVLAPIDSKALRGPVENAFRSKIPVVVIDSNLDSDRYATFVATNNYKGGAMGGAFLARILAEKGRVALLRNVEGNASADNRERGFLDEVKKYPGMKVVSSNQYGGSTTESAYKAAENILASLKTDSGETAVDGIFCPNESTAFGMLRALEDTGLAGRIRFVGFDSSPKLNDALRKGHIDGLVVQDPVKIGYLGIEKMVDVVSNKTVPRQIDVPATIVTKQNMDEPAVHALLSPDLKTWLNE